MKDGDILMNMMNEAESMSDDDKMFLYTRAVHSNHLISYHMHQIMERQRVVHEYSKHDDGRNESDCHRIKLTQI